MMARAFVLVIVLGACGHQRSQVNWPDAPIELRDDGDRDQAIDELWVTAAGPERDAARARIASAIARRLGDALDEDKPFVARALLEQLASLWQDDPANAGRGLAAHAALLGKLRALFAREGALEPAVLTLALLTEVDPGSRAKYVAEIDEILKFTDDLAVSENGPNAVRAQPIGLLHAAVDVVPLTWLVDRYVALLEERQHAVAALLAAQGGSIQLVRAHHDILASARNIAGALARSGRLAKIHDHLASLHGSIGTERELAIRAEILADQPTPDAYLELASALVAIEPDRRDTSDPGAALAVCLAGLKKFPHDTGLLIGAAAQAVQLGRIDQPIALYEAALRESADVDATTALKLAKLYAERIQRLASGGRPRAATDAWHGVDHYLHTVAKARPHGVWDQVTAIAETALGKGLLSQGRVDDAERALTDSIDHAPSIDAYEALTTLDYQTDRLSAAHRWAAQGLAMLGDGLGDRFHRAKLERLAADIERRAGHPRAAAALYLDSLRVWASLGKAEDLQRAIAAERLLESGRAMWYLGDPVNAVDLVLKAVDYEPDTAAIPAGAVSFLLSVGRYTDALDAFHRGLGSSSVGEYYKVYMSLWILGEAKRSGAPLDRLAMEYLTARHGDLWYEQLAQAATGHVGVAHLRALATTGPRKAELAFYSAVLALDPVAASSSRRLLEQVVDARLVMDTEYDLARRYLER